jgi:hypothetical protein
LIGKRRHRKNDRIQVLEPIVKRALSSLSFSLSLLLGTPALQAHASTLANWHFNSDDGLVSTGALSPHEGAGSLSLVGGSSALFTSGSPGDPAGFPLDSGWSVGGYPSQGTASGTAGFQGFVSTAGYAQVSISFDYKTQPSGNKWFLLQASTDSGSSWADVATFGLAAADQWFSHGFDVSSVLGAVDDKAGFGFRVVAIFKPGTFQYEAAEAGYNGDFGLVIDRLTVQATAVPEADAAWLAASGIGLMLGMAALRRRMV